ncbi:MAG: cell division protein FtsA [Candidatus Brocadiia bacterium]
MNHPRLPHHRMGRYLDIGASTTDVLVLNPPRFWVRSLLMAGNDLTNALVEKFGVSQDEAEKIKRRISQSRHREQIMNILEPVFDEIANEIQRSLGYYKSLVREVKFEKALLMGSAVRMAGTREMLGRRLQYDVGSMQKLERVKMAPGLDSEALQASLPGFGAALGLLVQGAGQARVGINMVPEEIALAGELSEKKPWVLAAAIGLLVVVGVVFGFETAYGARLESVDREVRWELVEQIDDLEQQYQSRQDRIEQLKNNPVARLASPGVERDMYLDLLPALAQALPRDVYLVSMNCTWQEPDELEQFAEEAGQAVRGRRRRQPRAPTGPQPQQGPPEWLTEAMLTGEGGPEGIPPEARGGRQRDRQTQEGFAIGEVQPEKSTQSELVVRFSAESRVVRRGKAFIEEQVLGSLREARFGEEDAPVFKEVRLIGELRDVYRRALDGKEVAEPAPGRTEHYVAFDAYGVVNLERSENVSGQQGRTQQ